MGRHQLRQLFTLGHAWSTAPARPTDDSLANIGIGPAGRRQDSAGGKRAVKTPFAIGRSKRRLLGGAAVCAFIGCGTATALAQTAPEPGAPAQATQLQQIVVTAQKREQNLQDVPVSVTAVTQQSIAVNRILNVQDLSAIAPNLTVHLSAGGTSLPAITLRGEQSYGVIPGSDKQVSLYLDGVYLGAALGSLMDMADIDRIEVLKGPQGTLFGRNATAGAVSFFSHNPTGKLGFHQEITGGNYDQFRSKTRVDLPTWHDLSASATFLHSQRQGDIQNLGAGQVWHLPDGTHTSPKWLGDQNINAVLAGLKYHPTDKLTVTYKFDWTENHGTPEGVGYVYLSPGIASSLGPLIAAAPPGSLTQLSRTRPDKVNNSFAMPLAENVWGHNLTARYQVTDAVTITNVFGYRYAHAQGDGYQLDGFGGLTAGPGLPFVPFGISSYANTRQWSDELQINVNTHWVAFTGGYLHYHATTYQGGPDEVPNLELFQVIPGGVITPNGVAPTYVDANADAVYAQGEFHVLPQVDLIAGYRYTHDHKIGTADNPGLPKSFTYDGGHPSYTVDVDYKPIQDVMLYVKYATAYVSGGATFGVSYRPETAGSWEGGVKADWLEHRLRTNLAVYSVNYTNEQVSASGENLIPALPQLGEVEATAGDAHADGFEFEGTVLPIKGLTLNTGLGYTDVKFTSVNPAFGTLQSFLPVFKPKWTANLAAHYDTPAVYDGANLSFNVDANYHSSFRIATAPGPADQSFAQAAWVVNARAALVHLPIGGGAGTVALWGKNILNDKSIDFADAIVVLTSASWQPAPTFGVDFVFDY